MTVSRIRRRSMMAAMATASIAVLVSGCGEDPAGQGGDVDVRVVDTAAVPGHPRWESYRGVFVPFTAAGPTMSHPIAPVGYERSPQGAVVAAMQAQARLALAPDDAWSQVAARLAARGPGLDAYALNRMFVSVVAAADPAHVAQFAGFRVAEWTAEATTVWLATRLPDGSLSAQPTRMVWRGDWKVELPTPSPSSAPDGRVATDPVALPDLNGYTEFRHV
ncbi:hypothetical protein ACTD5D_40030 [Nocardia takedensis]|uniref:hypothetical protein n=1 Tax=Nocardia takedensis TaxID=259390 RepID=UPI003F773A36